jgi:hypothetical protein
MSKLRVSGTSKLARQEAAEREAEVHLQAKSGKTAALLVKPAQTVPRSYRFRPSDAERLRKIVERASDEAGRPFSESDILRALLRIGEKTSTRRLLDEIKVSLFER